MNGPNPSAGRAKIELILASAGTGKTTRLAQELETALVSGEVRPEAVLATTFTRQAAAELAERARTRLLSVGRHEDAHRLQAARIGTVNAVCGRLVEQFAFELGLSPEVRVIDDLVAARTLKETLSGVVGPQEGQRLAELGARMCDLQWEGCVAQVVAAARANGMTAADLAESRGRSTALAQEVLGTKALDGDALDRALVDAMRQLVDAIDPGDKVTAVRARDRCRKNLKALEQGNALPWREWSSLVALNATKPHRDAAALVHAAAAEHDNHPQFHDDVLAATELVFTIAARTLEAYEDTKLRLGVIDFVDQEAHALALLQREDVAQRLAEEIDLVMVDEFQDTSPLQLAIFLKLAEIAPRSVWVGDQKQSIYGFRGTDPELMEAALELLERRDPAFVDETLSALFEDTQAQGGIQTLEKSWRSRPQLVGLTSDLFAAAFARHGMPAQRVRLEPGHPDEPEGLGPVVEVWDLELDDRRKTNRYALALAAGIDAFLDDDDVLVRDRASAQARALRLSDVAVLARRRDQGHRVAGALEDLGRRVVLPRPGLLKTAEGRLAAAALRRWADPGDRLARAELDRITRFPDAPDAWLQTLIAAREAEANPEPSPAIEALDEARTADPHADPTTALERCVAAMGLRDLCRRWGEARQRLGNLDALASLARCYVETQASELATASVPGLLAHLEQLGTDQGDEQAVLAGDEAVTLSTWHAAKGLEWPVTILFDLQWSRDPDVTGVQVEPGRARFDLRDPLADRWIRYLPQPFKANQTTPPFVVRAGEQPHAQRARDRHDREQLRLLYVAWTRARDRLILAGSAAKLYDKILSSLRSDEGPLLSHPENPGPDATATWSGQTLAVPVRTFCPGCAVPRSTQPGHAYLPREPREHPPAFRSPSSVAERGEIVQVFELGPSLEVHGLDPQSLGDAVHTFFAADAPRHPTADREAFAKEILIRFAVYQPDLPAHLVVATDGLRRFIATRWPQATLHPEHPVWHRTESGTIVRGTADLIVELPHAYAVIDHKAMLGTVDRALADVPGYAGQLFAYAEAITAATGREVSGHYVHLPLAARVVELARA